MDKIEIERGGWRLASVTSGAHLRNWQEIYEEMDFEVLLEKIDLSTENKDEAGCGTECTACYNETEPPYRLYVRPRERVTD